MRISTRRITSVESPLNQSQDGALATFRQLLNDTCLSSSVAFGDKFCPVGIGLAVKYIQSASKDYDLDEHGQSISSSSSSSSFLLFGGQNSHPEGRFNKFHRNGELFHRGLGAERGLVWFRPNIVRRYFLAREHVKSSATNSPPAELGIGQERNHSATNLQAQCEQVLYMDDSRAGERVLGDKGNVAFHRVQISARTKADSSNSSAIGVEVNTELDDVNMEDIKDAVPLVIPATVSSALDIPQTWVPSLQVTVSNTLVRRPPTSALSIAGNFATSTTVRRYSPQVPPALPPSLILLVLSHSIRAQAFLLASSFGTMTARPMQAVYVPPLAFTSILNLPCCRERW
ncbi:hypothetical protein GYMLUDRAFT_253379 [Collybiopsis luxurians FD-317 M1]|uniref:Uncharacterized protein n=1 Tax=Collybiopsis luxurians FD-317 M1 TaxID=944289 RepID=A0A0D0AIP7_9AGAR|nr:hypothetical protein GYMLUDRAFT_253379 [Collybiopsis luxurians FD-317 M1]